MKMRHILRIEPVSFITLELGEKMLAANIFCGYQTDRNAVKTCLELNINTNRIQ